MVQGIHEGIEGLKEIRILGKEQKFYQMVHRGAIESSIYQVKSQLITTAPRFILEVLLVVFLVTLVIGSLQLGLNLQVLVPTLGMFGFAAMRLMPAANSISTSLINIRFNRHAISLLYADLISLKETRQTKISTDTVLKKDGYFRDLTFRDVQFTYPKTKCPALKQVTLNFCAGE